ncbi:Gfo/Idh/MocA family protein [Adhaeribacter radiodurans]|uniref:Gfo/Idh/MocA family oxidoreductase n=1 Tax=Adhaeribacter radiodurans TaxID=2745197 RepID=A0A7L7LCK5_9BACT|nr:Gfo/Idh/MocA family oxidoreductase [Adhaeribacter radiodurans]QMU30477.1 Gfo/Idh/MocA family oxidoreductase [Adhaeribacter radiodurans]
MNSVSAFFGFLLVFLFCQNIAALSQVKSSKPLRVGVAGLVHGHVGWVFESNKRGDIEIIGIAEPDAELAQRYIKKYNLPASLIYSDLNVMLTKTKPEAVTAFNSIYNHLAVVQACAPRGIHVMVEKPLAVSLDHARQMEVLVRKHPIHLLTNYETTWYGSNHKAYDIIHTDKSLGSIRKMVVHDGHQGPKEIGVGPEFLAWLTDPVQNGGGALIDFGCYGANLITWLMQGQRPLSVTAVTQQLKPEIYPKVDDEATILVTYPGAQGIIQASWNWPYSRKDLEIYGQAGAVFALDNTHMQLRLKPDEPAKPYQTASLQAPYNDPFRYLTAVVRNDIKPNDDYNLSSLANNVIVVEILDAARRSAQSGKTILLEKEKTK